jgi:Family of unknown function (DUF5317)
VILGLAVVLGLVASVIRHRDRALSQIASLPIHSLWLAGLALVLQWPLIRAPGGPIQRVQIQQALFLLSLLLLLIFIWQNRHLISIRIVGIGIICNLLVILANGGWMPINPQTLAQINSSPIPEQWPTQVHYGYSKDIILLQEQTRLWVLSDILVLPSPFQRTTAFSLGDLIIALGIIMLLQGSVAQLPSARPKRGMPCNG